MRLVAERLVRSFGPRRIFGPLSFEVAAGRVLGVAGANGAGKTTLLRVLAGLLRPTTGHATLEGLDNSPAAGPRGGPWAIGGAGPDPAAYRGPTPAGHPDL